MKIWAMFGGLGLIWGSSFLLIKIALAPEGVVPSEVGLLDPLSLAAIRLTVAAVGFIALILLTRRKVPTDARTLRNLAIVGLFNNVIPFTLIPLGERSIDSGLATVLNATVPLFSVVIAHFALKDDKISLGKIFGLISGFAGVLLLATRSLDPSHPNPLPGQLAVIAASISYGAAAAYMRRTVRHVDPMTTACISISFGALIVLAVTILFVHPLPVFTTLQPSALRAVLALGALNTFIAYILFFTIINAWGASRTTMVTYLMPPIGLALGAIFEHEPIDWKLLIGTVLIVGGVALANLWRRGLRPVAASQPAAQAGR